MVHLKLKNLEVLKQIKKVSTLQSKTRSSSKNDMERTDGSCLTDYIEANNYTICLASDMEVVVVENDLMLRLGECL